MYVSELSPNNTKGCEYEKNSQITLLQKNVGDAKHTQQPVVEPVMAVQVIAVIL